MVVLKTFRKIQIAGVSALGFERTSKILKRTAHIKNRPGTPIAEEVGRDNHRCLDTWINRQRIDWRPQSLPNLSALLISLVAHLFTFVVFYKLICGILH